MYRYVVVSVLALSLLLARPAAGQGVVGVHGGVAVTDLGGADAADSQSRTGLHVGATYTFSVVSGIGVRVGVDYTAKGADATTTFAQLGEVPATLELDYLELPVLLRYGFGLGSSVSAHLLAGAVISLETSCQVTARVQGETVSGSCSDGTDDVDLGVAGGVGLSVPLASSLDLTGEVLYNLGIRTVAASGSIENRALLLRVGLAVPVGP